MADTFLFELVSPERLLLSEQAVSVVVPGSEGQFMVLKGHAPVMTTLRPGLVEATLGGGRVERIFVRGGFADTTPEGLTILAEEAISVADLSAEKMASDIRNAEEDVADATDASVKAAAELRLMQLREVRTAAGLG
jgi:F-type H+-transporting ATPase subunit epsilon